MGLSFLVAYILVRIGDYYDYGKLIAVIMLFYWFVSLVQSVLNFICQSALTKKTWTNKKRVYLCIYLVDIPIYIVCALFSGIISSLTITIIVFAVLLIALRLFILLIYKKWITKIFLKHNITRWAKQEGIEKPKGILRKNHNVNIQAEQIIENFDISGGYKQTDYGHKPTNSLYRL